MTKKIERIEQKKKSDRTSGAIEQNRKPFLMQTFVHTRNLFIV